SPDLTHWRERTPTYIRRDYRQGLCNIRAANPEASKHTSDATHQSRLEKEIKRPLTFQEVLYKMHKKKGTDQYISNKAQEVVKSYGQQMIDKYVREEEEPQLDPKVWVAASGAPKKGHVYGFGHSMNMRRVLSNASSSGLQETNAFTTPGALGTTTSEMMGFIRDEISSLTLSSSPYDAYAGV
ncbi:hypothetical protein Taro_052514, partial [Colocasia esculenta]|nr:hypothetical protein [Colocasia esculenta]